MMMVKGSSFHLFFKPQNFHMRNSLDSVGFAGYCTTKHISSKNRKKFKHLNLPWVIDIAPSILTSCQKTPREVFVFSNRGSPFFRVAKLRSSARRG